MQLHKQHTDNVVCMTLTVDYQGFDDEPPESFLEETEAVLKEVGVTFPSIICSDADSVVYEKSEIPYIPAVLVYDQAGNVQQFAGEGAYTDKVFPLVEELLAAAP